MVDVTFYLEPEKPVSEKELQKLAMEQLDEIMDSVTVTVDCDNFERSPFINHQGFDIEKVED